MAATKATRATAAYSGRNRFISLPHSVSANLDQSLGDINGRRFSLSDPIKRSDSFGDGAWIGPHSGVYNQCTPEPLCPILLVDPDVGEVLADEVAGGE